MAVPDAHGGAGVEDFRFNVVIGEEVQRAGVAGLGLGITLHNDICLPYFLAYCTPEQRDRWLPGIASGELITALAMTEPGIGSDLGAMTTRALREDGHYVLNGAKTFITNGINADLVITAVKTDPSQRHRGISLLVVERGMEGFERGRNLEKVGQHAQDTAELSFDDVCVPVANRLGEEGAGFGYLVANLPQERLSIAVAAVARPRRRWVGRWTTSASARPSDRPSARFRAHASRWPSCEPRSTSRRYSSTAACRRWRPASSPRPTPPRQSGGAPIYRAAWPTAACSCSAATGTWSSTRSRAPGPTRA